MSIPFVSFSSEELSNKPDLKPGDEITCPSCGEKHEVEPADDGSTVLLFYRCKGHSYLAAVDGKNIIKKDQETPAKERSVLDLFSHISKEEMVKMVAGLLLRVDRALKYLEELEEDDPEMEDYNSELLEGAMHELGDVLQEVTDVANENERRSSSPTNEEKEDERKDG